MNKFFQRVKHSHYNGVKHSRPVAEAVATSIQQIVGIIFASATLTWQSAKFIWEWFWKATLISGCTNALLYVSPISRGWALMISSVIHILIFGVIWTLGRKEIARMRRKFATKRNNRNEVFRSEPRVPRKRNTQPTNY